MSQKRGPKSNQARHVGQDFFALGGAPQPTAPSTSNLAQNMPKLPAKRPNEATFQQPVLAAKRPNLNSPLQNVSPSMSPIPMQQSVIRSTAMHSTSSTSSSSSSSSKTSWEDRAMVVPARDLRTRILEYEQNDSSEEMIERLLCGAAKQLQKTAKPDSILVLTLLYFGKTRPLFFCSNTIVEAFSSLLKREALSMYAKTKSNLVPVLVINLFQKAFHDESSWPEVFLKMYVEDALNERVWVDHEECKDFVDIIVASFKTRLPQRSQLQASEVSISHQKSSSTATSESLLLTAASHSSVSGGEESMADDASCSSNPSTYSDQGTRTGDSSVDISSRYADNANFVSDYVGEVINETLARRNINDVQRNVLKLLMVTAGIRPVRQLIAQRLEAWFQNPKLTRPSQDLLLTVCMNVTDADVDIIATLLRIRFKNKSFLNHFYLCMKELLNKEDSTFDHVLTTVINNELAGVRHLNNFHLISIAFQSNANRATEQLARVFLSIIFRKECFLKALRALLREIVRNLRHEHINFLKFVEALFDRTRTYSGSAEFATVDEEVLRRTPFTIIDLATEVIFLSIGQNVREAFSTSRSDRKEIIRLFQYQVAAIQRAGVLWIADPLMTRFLGHGVDPGTIVKTFNTCLRKMLFIEFNFDWYYRADGWPPENDRAFVQRRVAEVPLHYETLLTLLRFGLTKGLPISPGEVCDLLTTLITRAAVIYHDLDLQYPLYLGFPAEPEQLVLQLFETAVYSHPESTVFPADYKPPRMALRDSLLRVWLQLFILGVHMPATFGLYCWSHFPLFRMAVEMAITNAFHYPPRGAEELLGKEAAAVQAERTIILTYEGYLAGGQEINEGNSLLLPKLITFDPWGFPRIPSPILLEELKAKCSNQGCRLSQLLYQSRSPDFLLITIEKQRLGLKTVAPMPWLVELVESYENSFSYLPVQCLCEFLFGQISEEMLLSMAAGAPQHAEASSKTERTRKKDKRRKLLRLIAYLQVVIQSSGPNEGQPNELLKYIIHQLSSGQLATRTLAYKALYLIVSFRQEDLNALLAGGNTITTTEETGGGLPLLLSAQPEANWLQTKLPGLLKTPLQIQTVCNSMIDALDFETDPVLICEYLDFIASRVAIPDEKLVRNTSALLIKRPKIVSYILSSASASSELRDKFLDSGLRIFYLYLDSVRRINFNGRRPEEWRWVQFASAPETLLPLHPHILQGVILLLSAVERRQRNANATSLFWLLFGEDERTGWPRTFADAEQRQPVPLLDEPLTRRLLTASSAEVLHLVIEQLRPGQLVGYLDYYGLSVNAVTRILQSLDRLSAAEIRQLRALPFDRPKKLAALRLYWSQGVVQGVKFARNLLNYKGDWEGPVKNEDSEMSEAIDKDDVSKGLPSSLFSKSKKETQAEGGAGTFKKDDILKIFKERDVLRISQLTRAIAAELEDTKSATKAKKLTRLFLSEFSGNLPSLANLIVGGAFNSIFNVITILAVKDPKHCGFNSDLTALRKSLLALELESVESIEDTSFWLFFDRFFAKEPSAKGKKVKASKKKSAAAYQLRTPEHLDKFLRTFVFVASEQAQNAAWCEVYKDLAVEKYYNKDTELEDSNSFLQSVIFSRNRPYFLSLLLHKSNFSTMNHCIDYLLSDDHKDEDEDEEDGEGGDKEDKSDENDDSEAGQQLNPSAILDFLTICLSSPKLSIGRDDRGSDSGSKVFAKAEDVLQLSERQIRKLIQYVILENAVAKRTELVVKGCCVDKSKVDFVVGLLREYTEKGDGSDEKVALELYTRLYLHIPNIDLPSKLDDDQLELIQSGPCFMDKITHNLITSFMYVDGPHIVNEEQMRIWELAILKIASRHPLLLIRQLTMIPALLGGKVSLLNYEAFKSQNLLKIFFKFLNILRLLRPHLWAKQSRGVMQILDLYMDFFLTYHYMPRHHRSNEELLPMLHIFIDLLDDWLKHDSDQANYWIKSQKGGLTELSLAYPLQGNMIKSIISGLHTQHRFLLARTCQDSLVKLRGAQASQDKLIIALGEISKQSERMPEVAEYLLDEIRSCFMNPFTCEAAIKLSLRGLQHNPNLSRSIISTYLRCLQSDSSDVVKQALEQVPKFVILAQEYRYLIMKKAFELAIRGNTSALAKVNESFIALKSQLGC